MKKAYAQAGVDIDLGNKVKSSLPQMLASTHRKGVLGKVGGFGGLFQLDTAKYKQPVLVSSADGVGTKLKIAFALNKHDTIGQDLVNHCVNDIAVLGAEALFFLDYIGTGKLEPKAFEQIISGFAKACAENNCALIGGETAQMPGFYMPGEYDVSGTIVGAVEKSKMLDGKQVRAGDVVIGLPSSGLHTNGYSLARKIFFEKMKLKPTSKLADFKGSIGEELLKVHISYGPLTQRAIKKFNAGPDLGLRGMAHITGGGFVDNIPRVLPAKFDALIRKGTWEIPRVFTLMQEAGGIAESEMYQVFNMGVGMVLIASQKKADAILQFCKKESFNATVIGEVIKGRGEVQFA